MSGQRRKLLVLTSSTGGGHDMRARSIQAWAQTEAAADLNLDVEIFSTLESVSGVYRFGVEVYNWIQLHAPWLHHVYFNFLEFAAMHSSAKRISKGAAQRFREHLRSVKPDIIVSTHAHLNQGFFELARQTLGADNVRCCTYCGEMFDGYGFARHWANPAADAFVGATPDCCRAAAGHGVPPEKNHMGGFMLNPVFWDEPSPEGDQWLSQRRIDPDRFTLVLSTGANSAVNHAALLDRLEIARLELQVVALCGKNEDAFTELTARAARDSSLTLVPQRRLEPAAIAALLRRAGALVARPGTGSTSEAIQAGCPVIHNGLGGVMPQEHLTMKYLRAHGADRLIRRPNRLPKVVKRLLRPGAVEEARQQTRALHPGGHPVEILKILADDV